jgi:hypothetical protein
LQRRWIIGEDEGGEEVFLAKDLIGHHSITVYGPLLWYSVWMGTISINYDSRRFISMFHS